MNFKLFLLPFLFPVFTFAQKITKDENGDIIVFTHCIKRPIRDTLTYLKQFETNKDHYIGKPFSVLLNDMTQIQPKTVWPELNKRFKTFIIGNAFNFCEKQFSFHNTITLLITWQDTIPMDQFNYYGKKNQFFFTQEERDFYGCKIIKDIMVYR